MYYPIENLYIILNYLKKFQLYFLLPNIHFLSNYFCNTQNNFADYKNITTFVTGNFTIMNKRIQQFLVAEGISQSQFADTLGVARASVSHIVAGRNKPGFDFISSMSAHYPDLNLDWLITGKGKIYKSGVNKEAPAPEAPLENHPSDSLFAETYDEPVAKESQSPVFTPKKAEIQPLKKEIKQEVKTLAAAKEKAISRIIVFYNDNTYQVFNQ